MTKLPRVLIVDDDPDCADECGSTLTELGYKHVSAGTADQALQALEGLPDIGIMLIDVKLPDMDGVALLAQISERFGLNRPLVPIMFTGYGSFDTVVQAMRLHAFDFLSKPVSRSDYEASLARAAQHWRELVDIAQGDRIVDLDRDVSEIKSSLHEIIREMNERLPPVQAEPGKPSETLVPKDVIRRMIQTRNKRNKFFPTRMFADPAWDMVLDLAHAYFEDKPLAVSSACIASGAPMSTALRWIRELTDLGWIKRWPDTSDGRRDLVSLTDTAARAMMDYIASLESSHLTDHAA